MKWKQFFKDNNNWKYDFKGFPKKDKMEILQLMKLKKLFLSVMLQKIEKGDKENSFVITNKKRRQKRL